MEITGKNLGKKFGRNWAFRNMDVHIYKDSSVAITGSNGSGKSTLLKILSGFLTPSEGEVNHNGIKLGAEDHSLLNFTAPYIELPEEMTFDEFLQFHSTFRCKLHSNDEIAKDASLPLHKRIGEFSTGMKQRVQLSTAFHFKNSALLMDEPTSNLDSQGFEWWKDSLACTPNFPVVLASNLEAEISVCDHIISL